MVVSFFWTICRFFSSVTFLVLLKTGISTTQHKDKQKNWVKYDISILVKLERIQREVSVCVFNVDFFVMLFWRVINVQYMDSVWDYLLLVCLFLTVLILVKINQKKRCLKSTWRPGSFGWAHWWVCERGGVTSGFLWPSCKHNKIDSDNYRHCRWLS